MSRIIKLITTVLLLALLYLLLWPVPIDPVAWQPPPNPGYSGDFEVNQLLAAIELLPIGAESGPEDVAFGPDGLLYASSEGGRIIQLAKTGPRFWAKTGGRPLGLEFDSEGRLIVADAYRGLLAIENAQPRVLTSQADGIAINYANDVDLGPDGKIYFSDASTHFGAAQWGGSLPASVMEIIEHRGTGRLLEYDPQSRRTRTVLDGLHFANGVAVSQDGAFVLVAETGAYRVIRYWLSGPRQGSHEVLLANLPGFPDNLRRGLDGRFWLALVSPRLPLLEALAGWPLLRRVIFRLPEFVRPQPVAYGHVIAFDQEGRVTVNLQDPAGAYPLITAVAEIESHLYFGSLVAPAVGRVSKSEIGL